MARVRITPDDGYLRYRELTVSGTDNDPWSPKDWSVPADGHLPLEEALELARRLFGKGTIVTETLTLSRTESTSAG